MDFKFIMAKIVMEFYFLIFYHYFFWSSTITLSNIEKDYKLNLQQTFLFTSMAWFMIALFGSIPFMLSPLSLTFSDAFFESMSGITTTGSTTIINLDGSPKKYSALEINYAVARWNRDSCNGYNCSASA